MIRQYCDCCGQEVNTLYTFKYLVHIKHTNSFDGYCDNEGNRVSGREDSKELCIKCYNEILGVSYSKFEELNDYFKHSRDILRCFKDIPPPPKAPEPPKARILKDGVVPPKMPKTKRDAKNFLGDPE